MITVYSLTKTLTYLCVARVLYKIMQKEPQARILALCSSDQECAEWDRGLWTFHPEIFLPHGRTEDLWPEKQPILLACNAENPQNKATIVIFSDISKVHDWSLFEQYVWVTHTPQDSVRDLLPKDVGRRGFCEKDNRWEEMVL